MAVSGSYLSSIYNSSALDAVGKAVKIRQEATDSFMLTEEPEEANLTGENPEKGISWAEFLELGDSYTGPLDWRDPEVKRQWVKMGQPPMVANATGTGCYSKSTAADRGSLEQLVAKYFEEVKEEYGCSDDYMPYAPGLPEFDAAIESSMKRALYDKLEADPEAERLTRAIGGVWPPPDRLNLETMTYGPGAPVNRDTAWSRPRI
ncbi:hypothetical protein C4J81_19065 (plasmid) [Deltaproteobacteria bacterium Smac51]|nr:hypothetical protein C4J81_19065 [Deltaproteobacteria bacterium Smac51]